jgi:hypothetical protein
MGSFRYYLIDSTLYSRSLQKSVAKNFGKERKTLQFPGPQVSGNIVPFSLKFTLLLPE